MFGSELRAACPFLSKQVQRQVSPALIWCCFYVNYASVCLDSEEARQLSSFKRGCI